MDVWLLLHLYNTNKKLLIYITMRIELKKFGDKLISRPAGREAYLVAKAYILRDIPENELIEIDFAEIKVLGPSWADEFITPLMKDFSNVKLLNTANPTVKASLEVL